MTDNEIYQTTITDLIGNIIDEETFIKMHNERKQEFGYDEFKNYHDFYNHCVNCINDMTNSEKIWLYVLCNKINEGMINLKIDEHCREFTAFSFYFNKDRQLCITNHC